VQKCEAGILIDPGHHHHHHLSILSRVMSTTTYFLTAQSCAYFNNLIGNICNSICLKTLSRYFNLCLPVARVPSILQIYRRQKITCTLGKSKNDICYIYQSLFSHPQSEVGQTLNHLLQFLSIFTFPDALFCDVTGPCYYIIQPWYPRPSFSSATQLCPFFQTVYV